MNATKPMTRREIQHTVAGYDPEADPKNFERMFERDKDMLRKLGVPIITVDTPLGHSTEMGYRIDKEQYSLGELELTPAEIGLLSLATKLWQDTALEAETQLGLTKLKSNAQAIDSSMVLGLQPRIGHSTPLLERVIDAITQKQRISFTYRTAATGELNDRVLEPWTVLARGAGWYVAGWDSDRNDQRIFKLSRIQGDIAYVGQPDAYEIPADISVTPAVAATSEPQTALLAIKPGRGQSLRMHAQHGEHVVPEGFEPLEIQFDDLIEFADDVAALADSALVLEPPELRDAVIFRLTKVLGIGGHEGGTDGTA